MSIVNPTRTACRCRGKIDILFISEAVDWSGAPKNDNGFYLQSVGYAHEQLSGPMKVGLGKKGGGFPHSMLPGKAGNILEYRFFMISELDTGETRGDGIDKLNQ